LRISLCREVIVEGVEPEVQLRAASMVGLQCLSRLSAQPPSPGSGKAGHVFRCAPLACAVGTNQRIKCGIRVSSAHPAHESL
jgi:hypothetical protein